MPASSLYLQFWNVASYGKRFIYPNSVHRRLLQLAYGKAVAPLKFLYDHNLLFISFMPEFLLASLVTFSPVFWLHLDNWGWFISNTLCYGIIV